MSPRIKTLKAIRAKIRPEPVPEPLPPPPKQYAPPRATARQSSAEAPRINPWRDQLEGVLLENEGKPARERLTLIRIFEELRALGYEGSYDAIRRYAKRWRAERGAATAEAYIPLSFAPGEAYQFDWSHEIVLINGVTV